jgi:hypothetical protein
MFIVRYPTGVSITYNQARYLTYKSAVWELYTADPEKGGNWVASISPSAGCVVEAIEACKIENPTTDVTGRTVLLNVVKHLRDYSRYDFDLLIELKRALQQFDARARGWK